MATVPSAGCLLAKYQYYRTRLNSESSVSSSSSSCNGPNPGNLLDEEKANHGLPEMSEKCWWLKNFFHCETVPSSSVRIDMSSVSTHQS
ncbi:pancreatic progenitor cell differentiation and proliferation factor-like protein [Rhinatrema bivittatum]|uniref:pancreatic progenitor cell differentiation and proliferation factor-like protein n=1 Tax=Rhinatrema bivittatum TaxID=194408 RepID=UPI0011290F9D|nr:pancreatic progenitor cell differentiation and proliferation factor-like protein [Rhinatrema bivittatum]XP_029447117.1 pancreatic progenitor cell differentiation and proliferation factor-like protein [Rhinatrema bivittatum]